MIDRYVLREILLWTSVALVFLTAIMLSIAMKDVIGDLLGKGVDPGRILLFLLNLILEQLNITLPISCLFGGMLAAGRLSGDSEITAMRAAGISFPRIYVNFLVAGGAALVILFVMGAFLGPASARAREDFQNWLKTYHSLTMVQTGRFLGGATIESGSFDGQDIYAESRQGDRLYNVQIRRWHTELDPARTRHVQVLQFSIPIGTGYLTQIIQARHGELLVRRKDDGSFERLIRLEGGFSVELDENQRAYQVTRFEDGFMDYVIPPPPAQLGRLDVRPDNFTLPELISQIDQLDNGGFRINPLTILGPLAQQLGAQQGDGLAGLGGGGGLPPGVPEFIELPSIARMESISQQLELCMIGGLGMDRCPMPPELNSAPPELRSQLGLMLASFVKDAKATRTKFAYEVQNRIAGPVACLLFYFISFPLGMTVKRSGKGMSVVQALVLFAAYYTLAWQGAEQANSGKLSAAAAAWIPVFLLFCFGLYIMSRKTDGFSPFYFLTRPLRRLIDRLLRPLRRMFGPDRMLGRLYLAFMNSRLVRVLARLRDRITGAFFDLQERAAAWWRKRSTADPSA